MITNPVHNSFDANSEKRNMKNLTLNLFKTEHSEGAYTTLALHDRQSSAAPNGRPDHHLRFQLEAPTQPPAGPYAGTTNLFKIMFDKCT
jgi:hypothetical protein